MSTVIVLLFVSVASAAVTIVLLVRKVIELENRLESLSEFSADTAACLGRANDRIYRLEKALRLSRLALGLEGNHGEED